MIAGRLAPLLLALTAVSCAAHAEPALILGHRGFAWNHATNPFPENTALSVHAALIAGAQGVEIDVVKTADDVFVLRHDDRMGVVSPGGLPRSTCRGEISAQTWDELRGCVANPHNRTGYPTPFSRLEDVLALSDEAILILDIKNDVRGPDELRTAHAAVALLEAHHALHRAILMLYQPSTAAFATGLGARVCLKQHHLHGFSRPQMAELVTEVGAWGGCTWSQLVQDDYARAMADRGLPVITYHLSHQPGAHFDRAMGGLLRRGVHGIITDQIERAVVLRAGGQ